MTGMIIGVRGGILGMIQGVTAGRSDIETIMTVGSLTQEGIHVVGIMIMNMIESETDMKVQGERLVCNCNCNCSVFVIYELIQVLKTGISIISHVCICRQI
jgi:hypothetical protein